MILWFYWYQTYLEPVLPDTHWASHTIGTCTEDTFCVAFLIVVKVILFTSLSILWCRVVWGQVKCSHFAILWLCLVNSWTVCFLQFLLLTEVKLIAGYLTVPSPHTGHAWFIGNKMGRPGRLPANLGRTWQHENWVGVIIEFECENNQ